MCSWCLCGDDGSCEVGVRVGEVMVKYMKLLEKFNLLQDLGVVANRIVSATRLSVVSFFVRMLC